MASSAPDVDSAPPIARWQRVLFILNAAVACFGAGLSFTLTVLGTYPSTNTDPTQLGYAGQGVVGRVLDFFTYFTIWSNILVAVIMVMLAIRPDRQSFVFRVLRLDAVLMITVTGLIYNLVLSGLSELQGLEVVTNSFDHVITPLVTVVVWLVAGPRGWVQWRTVPASLVLPLIWLVFALVHGAVIGAYPYPFLDVATKGYPTVLMNSFMVLIFGIVLALIFWGIDAALTRLTRRAAPVSA